MRLVGVPLSADQITRFYEGFSNGVLWPLFHYLLEQIPLQVSDWEGYVEANEVFADVVAAHYRPGDLIWVHDYQLFLLPGLLRERLPAARIGFFLHIPFPSEELFRTLPSRDRILQGMLGADLVGFHTPAYLRHFATSLTDILGHSVEIDRVQLPGREVRLGVFPMGVDATSFAALADDPAVAAEAEAIRGDGSVRILVGVDRLDYTKGIPRRLLAYERMLHDPSRAPGAGAPGAGGGAVAHQRRRLPGVPGAGGRAGRPDQRRLRHARAGCRCTTSTAAVRSRSWSRSTAPPT